MVIRPDPPSRRLSGRPARDRSSVTPFTHSAHGGAQISLLREALIYMSNPAYGDSRLSAAAAVRASPGIPRPSPSGRLPVSTARRSDDARTCWKNFNEGQRSRDGLGPDLFLLWSWSAHTYMMMGLLPFDPPANAHTRQATSAPRSATCRSSAARARAADAAHSAAAAHGDAADHAADYAFSVRARRRRLMADVVLVSMPFGPLFWPSLGLSLLQPQLASRGVSVCDRILHDSVRRAASASVCIRRSR